METRSFSSVTSPSFKIAEIACFAAVMMTSKTHPKWGAVVRLQCQSIHLFAHERRIWSWSNCMGYQLANLSMSRIQCPGTWSSANCDSSAFASGKVQIYVFCLNSSTSLGRLVCSIEVCNVIYEWSVNLNCGRGAICDVTEWTRKRLFFSSIITKVEHLCSG